MPVTRASKVLKVPEHNSGPVIALTGIQLLGIYTGAWDGPPSEGLAADRKWRSNRRIPAGMGLVVPVERIVETITFDPGLKRRHAEIIAKERVSR